MRWLGPAAGMALSFSASLVGSLAALGALFFAFGVPHPAPWSDLRALAWPVIPCAALCLICAALTQAGARAWNSPHLWDHTRAQAAIIGFALRWTGFAAPAVLALSALGLAAGIGPAEAGAGADRLPLVEFAGLAAGLAAAIRFRPRAA